MFRPPPTAEHQGYQPDIKAFCTRDIMSCHSLSVSSLVLRFLICSFKNLVSIKKAPLRCSILHLINGPLSGISIKANRFLQELGQRWEGRGSIARGWKPISTLSRRGTSEPNRSKPVPPEASLLRRLSTSIQNWVGGTLLDPIAVCGRGRLYRRVLQR